MQFCFQLMAFCEKIKPLGLLLKCVWTKTLFKFHKIGFINRLKLTLTINPSHYKGSFSIV